MLTIDRKFRFVEHINGDWVTLTIAPGEVIEHNECHSHEEGWSRRTQQWHVEDDGRLYCEVWEEGRDCDGRSSWHCVVVAMGAACDRARRVHASRQHRVGTRPGGPTGLFGRSGRILVDTTTEVW